MGLYQYIREQEYRNDVVGDLGRWLKSHSRERPDRDSLALKLASEEYVSCGEWTSQHAVKSLQANTEFQRIAIIEPRMTALPAHPKFQFASLLCSRLFLKLGDPGY